MDLMSLTIIALVTCFFSFGVQTSFLIWYKLTKSSLIKEYKHVMQYTSGYIGDGVLVPLTNIFAFLSLGNISVFFEKPYLWIPAIAGGYFIVFTSHYGQEKYAQTNWTMPKVGKWNTLGLYHALFMFSESSILWFAFFHFVEKSIFQKQILLIDSPVKYAFLSLFLFLLTFIYDYWAVFFKELYRSKIIPKITLAYRKIGF